MAQYVFIVLGGIDGKLYSSADGSILVLMENSLMISTFDLQHDCAGLYFSYRMLTAAPIDHQPNHSYRIKTLDNVFLIFQRML